MQTLGIVAAVTFLSYIFLAIFAFSIVDIEIAAVNVSN